MKRGARPGRAAAWLRLFRLPNLLTVPGDPLAGAFLAASGSGAPFPVRAVVSASISALAFYMAGLLLNDWVDRDEDGRDRPGRPLPSGAVGPGTVLAVAAGLGVLGALAAAMAGPRVLVTACALAVLILLYHGRVKRTAWSAWLMGGCRAASFGLGVAAADGGAGGGGTGGPWPAVAGMAALGCYVAAVTRAARKETERAADRPSAAPAWVVLAVGLWGVAAAGGWARPGAAAAGWGLLALAWAGLAAWRWERGAGPAAIGGLLGALPFWQAYLISLSRGPSAGWIAAGLGCAGAIGALLRRRIPAS